MTDKEAIDNLKNYIECLMEDYGYYKDIVEFRDSVEHLEKSLQTQQAEIKKKDKMIDEIQKEVRDHIGFENRLKRDNKEPDLFNQGRFYISQIIYDILNDVQNPEGIHKENKCIQYIDYISIQKVKDKIEKEIKYHEKNILEIEDITMFKSKTAKEEAEIEFNKYAIVVLKKILQELIEEREEK